MVGKIRDRVMGITSIEEFTDFYNEVKDGFGDYELFIHCACRYDMYNLKYNLPYMRNRCMNQNFPYGRKARIENNPEKGVPNAAAGTTSNAKAQMYGGEEGSMPISGRENSASVA